MLVFIGHLGAGLALKKVAPELNPGLLLFAALFLDVLPGLFVLAGIEQIIVPVNYVQLHYLNFIFPWSHSLLATFIWSLLAFGVTYVGGRVIPDQNSKPLLSLLRQYFFTGSVRCNCLKR